MMTLHDESKLPKWARSVIDILRSQLTIANNQIRTMQQQMDDPDSAIFQNSKLLVPLDEIQYIHIMTDDDKAVLYYKSGIQQSIVHPTELVGAWTHYKKMVLARQMQK